MNSLYVPALLALLGMGISLQDNSLVASTFKELLGLEAQLKLDYEIDWLLSTFYLLQVREGGIKI